MMPDYHARNTSMSHLSPERLAALVDETPTAAELAHLAGCAECARERAAYRNLVELAVNNSATIATPLTSWDALRPALARDGVIDDGARAPLVLPPIRTRSSRLLHHRRFRNSTGSAAAASGSDADALARGLSPPVRILTDPGARLCSRF